jgi:trk system potassium uptake protein TrkA
MSMNVIVIAGPAVLGTRVAEALAQRGHQVTQVESLRVSAPALLDAGATHAQLLVAAADTDEANLLAAVLARREFGVPRVLARVVDPARAWLYTPALGVDAALEDATLLVRLAEDLLALDDLDTLARLRQTGFRLVEASVPAESPALGKTIDDLALPAGCTPIVVWRGGQAYAAARNFELQAGDTLAAVARHSQTGALGAVLAPHVEPAPGIQVVETAVPEDHERWRRPADAASAPPEETPTGDTDADQTPD